MTAVEDRLGRFFGKRGRAVVEGNLAVIGAAYDTVINVTAGIAAPHPTREASTAQLEVHS